MIPNKIILNNKKTQMKKQFIYKGEVFNMELELNTEIERTPNGNRIHTLKVKGESNGYTAQYGIKDKEIRQGYEVVEQHCREFVDADIPDSATLIFASLGLE